MAGAVGTGSGRVGPVYASASALCPPNPFSQEGREIPAASAMPANGTPLAEKNDFKASSKSSGDTEAPPLLAVRMAAIRRGEARED